VRRAAARALEYPERQQIGRPVLEDVGMTLCVDGVGSAEREERARRAHAAAGIPAERFAARAPFALSEGEKRRVAIAGLLADPAPLLLFDEPTAGLDPEGRRALRDAFAALRHEQRTVVFASHDLDFVHAVADRVVLLARAEGEPARLARDGAPVDVFRDGAAMGEAAIPPPDVVAVEEALRDAGLLDGAPVRGGDDLVDRLAAGRDCGAAPGAARATDVGAGAA
jgi:energy-coupling factor transport system ATP-binding protein